LERFHERAGEPRTMKLYPGAGHLLIECRKEMTELVSDRLLQKV
jgi:alpha-beta hydrolase superfamily lysophospholipase